MNTKSKIQLISEEIERKNRFKHLLEKLLDMYHVEDNVFTMIGESLAECTSGYFSCEKEYDSLSTLFEDITDVKTTNIRIVNDNLFQVGRMYNTLSECPENSEYPILHLETQEYVNA